MINIVHVEANLNDERVVTSLNIKMKYIKNGNDLTEHQLVATVSAAFYKTTLLVDVGKNLKTELNPKRGDIVNLVVILKNNSLQPRDVSNFLEAFQKAIDETSLF